MERAGVFTSQQIDDLDRLVETADELFSLGKVDPEHRVLGFIPSSAQPDLEPSV